MDIQQAINDASLNGGGLVSIPVGIHDVDETLLLRSSVDIVGESYSGTVLRPTGHFPLFTPDMSGGGIVYWSVRNLTIDYMLQGKPSDNPDDKAFYLPNWQHNQSTVYSFCWDVDNLRIKNAYWAMYDTGSFMSRVKKVWATCRNGIYKYAGTSMRYDQCWMHGYKDFDKNGVGWHLAGALYNSMLSTCVVEWYHTNEIPWVIDDCRGLKIDNLYIERNKVNAANAKLLQISRTDGFSINGSYSINNVLESEGGGTYDIGIQDSLGSISGLDLGGVSGDGERFTPDTTEGAISSAAMVVYGSPSRLAIDGSRLWKLKNLSEGSPPTNWQGLQSLSGGSKIRLVACDVSNILDPKDTVEQI